MLYVITFHHLKIELQGAKQNVAQTDQMFYLLKCEHPILLGFQSVSYQLR